MKILFIGPYRQNDGWGCTARNYIKALQTIEEIDLAIRPIYLSQVINHDLPDSFLNLETKVRKTHNVVIQHSLPNLFHYSNKFKNIGIFVSETRNLKYVGWPYQARIMDGIMVSTKMERSNLVAEFREMKDDKPVWNVGEPLEIDKEKGDLEVELMKNHFTFYYTGEFSDKTNIEELIKAYYLEFDLQDNACLLLHCFIHGLPELNTLEVIKEKCNKIKKELRKYHNDRYPRITIITSNLTDQQINNLHEECNCFILASKGESFNKASLSAMAWGNPVIAVKGTGPTDYIDNRENGWIIDSELEPCSTLTPPLPYLYTCREKWYRPNLFSLRLCMRQAYLAKMDTSFKADWESIQEHAKSVYKKYSYKNIGNKIYQCLKSLKT